MTDTLDVARDEHGIVRVFAVDLTGAEAEAFADDPGSVARALGLDRVDMRYVDVFPTQRLAGLSLTDYLAEGHGIPPAALDEHALALNGADGYVAVLASGAFGDGGRTLGVTQPLRHLATLAEEDAGVSFGALPAESARPAAAAPPGPEPDTGTGPKRTGFIVAAVLLGVFILAILVSAGFR